MHAKNIMFYSIISISYFYHYCSLSLRISVSWPATHWKFESFSIVVACCCYYYHH